MTTLEMQRAMQVLSANDIFGTVERMNRRMDSLRAGYTMPLRTRMEQMEAQQRALSTKLDEVECWIDGEFAQQLQFLQQGQVLLMEKLEDVAAPKSTETFAPRMPSVREALRH